MRFFQQPNNKNSEKSLFKHLSLEDLGFDKSEIEKPRQHFPIAEEILEKENDFKTFSPAYQKSIKEQKFIKEVLDTVREPRRRKPK